jgi:hypothetical protein
VPRVTKYVLSAGWTLCSALVRRSAAPSSSTFVGDGNLSAPHAARDDWSVSMPSRARGLIVLAAVGTLALPSAAGAHGGTDDSRVTNYLTRVQSVSPAADTLEVEVVGGEGLVVVTNRGPDEVIVFGYVGEPYLRIIPDGVYTNLNSPATYVNSRRDANVDVPTEVSPTDPPRWEQISSGNTARWHDHRVHWMGTVPPANVEADPDSFHVVIDRWELPMSVGATPVMVSGDTVWIPPPNRTAWLLSAVVVFAVALLTLQWHRLAAWTTTAWLATGTVASIMVAIGRVGAPQGSGPPTVAAFLVPAGLVALLIAAARRAARSPQTVPPVAPIAGLVLLANAASAWEYLGASQILSGVSAPLNRVAVVAQLGIGLALSGAWLVNRFGRADTPAAEPATPEFQPTRS